MAWFLLKHPKYKHTHTLLPPRQMEEFPHTENRAERLAKLGKVWLLVPTWMEILQLVPLQQAKYKWHICKFMGTWESTELDFCLRFLWMGLQRRGATKLPPFSTLLPSATTSFPQGKQEALPPGWLAMRRFSFLPELGPQWAWFSERAPLVCRCLGSGSFQRPSPAPPAAQRWRWFGCGVAYASKAGLVRIQHQSLHPACYLGRKEVRNYVCMGKKQ